MNEVSQRITRIRDKDIKGAVEEIWTKMKHNAGGEYAMCGVFQKRFLETLYRGGMELRGGGLNYNEYSYEDW